MSDKTNDLTRVTPGGQRLGLEAARLCDRAVQQMIASGEWSKDERCSSCAFRSGTVPNGCPQTQLDALKCVMEQVPFFCHATARPSFCAGWQASRRALRDAPKVICPWDYSPEDKE